MSFTRGIVLCLSVFLTALFSAYAEARRLAWVVGIDKYTSINALTRAGNDASAVGALLAQSGFEWVNQNEFRDLTRVQVLSQLGGLRERVRTGDEVVFFFAGHGVQIGGNNYLLPRDVPRVSLEIELNDHAVSLQRIMAQVKDAGARFSLFIIDACRDNPLPPSPLRNLAESRGMSLSPTQVPRGQIVFMSAERDQTALDRLGDADPNPNSVFTRSLLQHMRVPGIPIERVMGLVQQEVEQTALLFTNPQTKLPHAQRPAAYMEVRLLASPNEQWCLLPGTSGCGSPVATAPPIKPSPTSQPVQTPTPLADNRAGAAPIVAATQALRVLAQTPIEQEVGGKFLVSFGLRPDEVVVLMAPGGHSDGDTFRSWGLAANGSLQPLRQVAREDWNLFWDDVMVPAPNGREFWLQSRTSARVEAIEPTFSNERRKLTPRLYVGSNGNMLHIPVGASRMLATVGCADKPGRHNTGGFSIWDLRNGACQQLGKPPATSAPIDSLSVDSNFTRFVYREMSASGKEAVVLEIPSSRVLVRLVPPAEDKVSQFVKDVHMAPDASWVAFTAEAVGSARGSDRLYVYRAGGTTPAFEVRRPELPFLTRSIVLGDHMLGVVGADYGSGPITPGTLGSDVLRVFSMKHGGLIGEHRFDPGLTLEDWAYEPRQRRLLVGLRHPRDPKGTRGHLFLFQLSE